MPGVPHQPLQAGCFVPGNRIEENLDPTLELTEDQRRLLSMNTLVLGQTEEGEHDHVRQLSFRSADSTVQYARPVSPVHTEPPPTPQFVASPVPTAAPVEPMQASPLETTPQTGGVHEEPSEPKEVSGTRANEAITSLAITQAKAASPSQGLPSDASPSPPEPLPEHPLIPPPAPEALPATHSTVAAPQGSPQAKPAYQEASVAIPKPIPQANATPPCQPGPAPAVLASRPSYYEDGTYWKNLVIRS